MPRTRNYREVVESQLRRDPQLAAEVERELLNAKVAMMVYEARTEAGLTQAELAALIESKQPVIARLERADYDGHSLSMLSRIATALKKRVQVVFEDLDGGGALPWLVIPRRTADSALRFRYPAFFPRRARGARIAHKDGELLSGTEFRALVSGQRRGVSAAALRGLLAVGEIPYALAMRWRNRRYDAGRDVTRVPAPVISVGNLTLGGTGKTPLVEWLARWYRARGVRVSLVSRGYGAAPNAVNDEALELEQKLPDVPHLQDRDRVASARIAIEELETELILFDDGFQHRRLARELDIVVLDALEPFGFEHVFPRGTLREPVAGLQHAQVVVLSRCDLVSDNERAAIRERALRLAPGAAWVEASHAPQALRSATGRHEELSWLAGTRVAAFCGIGNPTGFRRTLANLGCEVVDFREFPDHHRYSRDDIESLIAWAERLDVDEVITTHKDLVKIDIDHLGKCPLWALVIGLEVQAGLAALEAQLAAVMPRRDDMVRPQSGGAVES